MKKFPWACVALTALSLYSSSLLAANFSASFKNTDIREFIDTVSRNLNKTILVDKNGERRWVPLTAGRITTKGDFPEEMHVSLSPQRLAATVASEPQVLFLPDGEISRFTLTLQSYDKQHHFRVVSQGAAPVSVENDG